MKNPIVEPGTMLYDVDAQMIGWVVGKHKWDTGFEDCDIEWSNGVTEYFSVNCLQHFIKAYIMLEEQKNT